METTFLGAPAETERGVSFSSSKKTKEGGKETVSAFSERKEETSVHNRQQGQEECKDGRVDRKKEGGKRKGKPGAFEDPLEGVETLRCIRTVSNWPEASGRYYCHWFVRRVPPHLRSVPSPKTGKDNLPTHIDLVSKDQHRVQVAALRRAASLYRNQNEDLQVALRKYENQLQKYIHTRQVRLSDFGGESSAAAAAAVGGEGERRGSEAEALHGNWSLTLAELQEGPRRDEHHEETWRRGEAPRLLQYSQPAPSRPIAVSAYPPDEQTQGWPHLATVTPPSASSAVAPPSTESAFSSLPGGGHASSSLSGWGGKREDIIGSRGGGVGGARRREEEADPAAMLDPLHPFGHSSEAAGIGYAAGCEFDQTRIGGGDGYTRGRPSYQASASSSGVPPPHTSFSFSPPGAHLSERESRPFCFPPPAPPEQPLQPPPAVEESEPLPSYSSNEGIRGEGGGSAVSSSGGGMGPMSRPSPFVHGPGLSVPPPGGVGVGVVCYPPYSKSSLSSKFEHQQKQLAGEGGGFGLEAQQAATTSSSSSHPSSGIGTGAGNAPPGFIGSTGGGVGVSGWDRVDLTFSSSSRSRSRDGMGPPGLYGRTEGLCGVSFSGEGGGDGGLHVAPPPQMQNEIRQQQGEDSGRGGERDHQMATVGLGGGSCVTASSQRAGVHGAGEGGVNSSSSGSAMSLLGTGPGPGGRGDLSVGSSSGPVSSSGGAANSYSNYSGQRSGGHPHHGDSALAILPHEPQEPTEMMVKVGDRLTVGRRGPTSEGVGWIWAVVEEPVEGVGAGMERKKTFGWIPSFCVERRG